MTPPHVTIKLTINEAEALNSALDQELDTIARDPKSYEAEYKRAVDRASLKVDRALQAKFVAGLEKP